MGWSKMNDQIILSISVYGHTIEVDTKIVNRFFQMAAFHNLKGRHCLGLSRLELDVENVK